MPFNMNSPPYASALCVPGTCRTVSGARQLRWIGACISPVLARQAFCPRSGGFDPPHPVYLFLAYGGRWRWALAPEYFQHAREAAQPCWPDKLFSAASYPTRTPGSPRTGALNLIAAATLLRAFSRGHGLDRCCLRFGSMTFGITPLPGTLRLPGFPPRLSAFTLQPPPTASNFYFGHKICLSKCASAGLAFAPRLLGLLPVRSAIGASDTRGCTTRLLHRHCRWATAGSSCAGWRQNTAPPEPGAAAGAGEANSA